MRGKERQVPKIEIPRQTPSLEEVLTLGLEQKLVQAVQTLQEEGRPVTYGNMVREILATPNWEKINGSPVFNEDTTRFLIYFSLLFNNKSLLFNSDEEPLFGYIKKHQGRLGISLFSEELEKHLDVEARTTRIFREDLGYQLICGLPDTFQKVCSAREKPVFRRLDVCERGIVGTLVIDRFTLVVKHTLSDQETEIARHLGKKGLAPQVYEGTRWMIAEEYIFNPPVMELAPTPLLVGDCIGRALRAIHEEGIVYDDRVLDHVLVGEPPDFRVRIIDLGSAYWGNDFGKDWEEARLAIEELYKRAPKNKLKALPALEKWVEK